MQVKTQAIVLSALRYQEKSLIVKCFTQDFGLKTYFVRNAFSGKNKKLNNAYFQPLNQLQLDATHKNKGSLEYINDLKLIYPYQSIPVEFYKNLVSIFLAEILSNTIKEEQPNDKLFLFLITSLKWFDEHEFSVDFHLWFLLQYTKFLGFYPDDSDLDLLYFNPNEGGFTQHFTSNCFNEDDTLLFKNLFKISIKESKLKLTNKERKQLLKQLLYYYELHVIGFKPIKSIDVLSNLF